MSMTALKFVNKVSHKMTALYKTIHLIDQLLGMAVLPDNVRTRAAVSSSPACIAGGNECISSASMIINRDGAC